ncbi:MAG: response regulator [Okeania sp. SIO2G4]|uniref:adenylate/guanylate cyclase domain-containing protein n=1 Tax=unclassified Okeania TaxID=2634635 RepID=UPI0013B62F11|nr:MULTISPECIES: adenylate/guanylate cyclase domain-containing protein [unclassified Okeania]NEP06037.1 response regulator [Okeania sp. SIO4D6]NEP72386.1 response regulator [Okeania sp. SIO2G5]NEP93224.1 response regulator [Okeania sp. SIO2F5]NEQ91203.1 response regulator [Okeania sp. SIO2G4]
MKHGQGKILVVDDNQVNRELLVRRLKRERHLVTAAINGFQALEIIQSQPFDLVLLDIMMPQMNGYEVLETLKSDPKLRHIPVIMISAVDDIDSIVRCIELGAEDYLSKPFNPILLKARINACLEKKTFRDQERAYLKELAEEKQKSERLLLNILPEAIAQRLKQGEETIADSFNEVTVLFADLVGFTKISANLSPAELVELLNNIFSVFDELADKYGLEKIKTIGDAYMIVGGLPVPKEDHAEAIADMALEMLTKIQEISTKEGKSLQVRIGINTGAVEAGVIGTKKFAYDLWGDTVNTAHRMESHGIAGVIQVAQATYDCLADKYRFEERGVIDIKGKGNMRTYILLGRKE